jgi:hypothetical protein
MLTTAETTRQRVFTKGGDDYTWLDVRDYVYL